MVGSSLAACKSNKHNIDITKNKNKQLDVNDTETDHGLVNEVNTLI